MNIIKLIHHPLSIICVIILCFSCDEQELITEDRLSPRDFTHLSISLTDAPINMDEVNIDIMKVKILTDKIDEEITLSTKSDIYNLLDFQNGIKTLLAESDLMNVKTIYQIRLILGERNNVVVAGESFPLIVSENLNDLLTIHCTIPLTREIEKEILLDFDAEKSIFNNAPGVYVLRPHIRIMD
jgi:hypothetical protein